MRSLLIVDGEAAPQELSDWLRKGSTSLNTVSATDLSAYVSTRALGVDRVVLWAGSGDADVRTLAASYAAAERADQRRADVLYVSTRRGSRPPGFSPDQAFTWPEDKDTLQMVLTVGNG